MASIEGYFDGFGGFCGEEGQGDVATVTDEVSAPGPGPSTSVNCLTDGTISGAAVVIKARGLKFSKEEETDPPVDQSLADAFLRCSIMG